MEEETLMKIDLLTCFLFLCHIDWLCKTIVELMFETMYFFWGGIFI